MFPVISSEASLGDLLCVDGGGHEAVTCSPHDILSNHILTFYLLVFFQLVCDL